MFSIGDFARHGRVSVRMLRHYDAIGLLPPAHVDEVTGYRSYRAQQLWRLNRIVALKDLGFTLAQVQEIVDDALTPVELRGMLRMRQAQLAEQVAVDQARLRQVEVRLRTIEEEGTMPSDDVQLKTIPAARVAELTGTAGGFEPGSITPVIGPLYERLMETLEQAGVTPTGPAIARYEDAPGGGVLIHAGIQVGAEAAPSAGHDFDVVDLPGFEAATIVHRGSMDTVLTSIQQLSTWIEASDHRSTGYNREVYLEMDPDDETTWVTELQEPVVRA